MGWWPQNCRRSRGDRGGEGHAKRRKAWRQCQRWLKFTSSRVVVHIWIFSQTIWWHGGDFISDSAIQFALDSLLAYLMCVVLIGIVRCSQRDAFTCVDYFFRSNGSELSWDTASTAHANHDPGLDFENPIVHVAVVMRAISKTCKY